MERYEDLKNKHYKALYGELVAVIFDLKQTVPLLKDFGLLEEEYKEYEQFIRILERRVEYAESLIDGKFNFDDAPF